MSLRHWPIFDGAPMAQRRTAGGKNSDPLVCMNCSEGTSGHWRRRPGCNPVAGTGGCTMGCRRHRQGAAGRRLLGGEDRLDERRRDVLIVKADRQEPLVVVRLSLAAETAKNS